MTSTEGAARSTDISLRTAAVVAGVGLLLMAIAAPFVQFSVLQGLVVPADAGATVANIGAFSGLFRIGIVAFLVVAILDVIVAWALYVLLKPVNESLSVLAAWFRVAYAAIFALALNNLFGALQLATGSDFSRLLAANQLQAQVMLLLSSFTYGWDIGLVIFGLHLLVLGYLMLKSDYVPRWLGVLLLISGLGYLIDSFGKFLVPNYNVTVSAFTFVGEVVLIFWLLWKSFRGFDKRVEKKS